MIPQPRRPGAALVGGLPHGGLADQLTVVIERTEDGLVFRVPAMRGLIAGPARGPVAISHALEHLWREADIATYAAARGQVRDVVAFDRAINATDTVAEREALDPTVVGTEPPEHVEASLRQSDAVRASWEKRDHRRGRPARPVAEERRRARALLWVDNEDGSWTSPAGMRLSESDWRVQAVIVTRARLARDHNVISPPGVPSRTD